MYWPTNPPKQILWKFPVVSLLDESKQQECIFKVPYYLDIIF